jgi:anti-anti-sigma regulatory factor
MRYPMRWQWLSVVTPVVESPLIGVDVQRRDDVLVLKVTGLLDETTHRSLRDAIIDAALDEPNAVLIDVNDLSVPSESAWSVLTSAHWYVSTWPDVPILLVCAHPQRQLAITRCGVDRYVPVYRTDELALDTVAGGSLHRRRRVRTQLPVEAASIGVARGSIADRLTAWAQGDLIPIASTVAAIFVENVLAHTDSAPILIVESYRNTVVVAVEDGSRIPAGRHEDTDRGAEAVSGLSIVSALCREWGSIPTSTGKTVWALVGRDSQLWGRDVF